MTLRRSRETVVFSAVVCLITGTSNARAQDTAATGSISGVVTSSDRGINVVAVNKQLGIFPVVGLEWRF